jgi:CBS domain-containing protein/sporulation protein YlmC with PRC-barrel domain
MFFLSKLLGQTVRDVEGRSAGTLQDVTVSLRQKYPRVTTLVVKRGNRRLAAAWSVVSSLEESGVLLRIKAGELAEAAEPQTGELLLSGQVLDKQIVDTEGRKVIRVNDIQLARSGPSLRVVAVDVSSGAILRRVGLSRVSNRMAKNPKPTLIDWSNVDLQASDTDAVRLTVPRTDLSLLHPADIADLAHELTPEERAAVFEELEDEIVADTFEEMHPSIQTETLLDMPVEKAAELLSNMSPDDAADLLAGLPKRRAGRYLALMDKDDADEIRELLSYPENSAGGIMTTEYAHVPAEVTAAEAIELLREQEPEVETVYYIYVIDKRERLLGVFSLRDLLTVPAGRRVKDFMRRDPITVQAAASEAEVTQTIAKYNLLALPVVDEDYVLHGIVTIDDAIDLVLPLAWKKRLPRIFR